MTVFLFWNVHQGTAAPYIQAALLENNVDVLVVAEDTSSAIPTTFHINVFGETIEYLEYAPFPSKIRFFTKIGSGELTPIVDDGARISIRNYKPKKWRRYPHCSSTPTE
jgi:hypothetical protein